jgi:hypothetical protein
MTFSQFALLASFGRSAVEGEFIAGLNLNGCLAVTTMHHDYGMRTSIRLSWLGASSAA